MATMKHFLMIAVGLGLGVMACSKSDSGSGGAAASASSTTAAASKGVCNKIAAAGKCNEESGDPDSDKSGCELTHGTWASTGSCPTDKLFATCNYGTTKIYYYAGAQGPDAILTMSEEFAKTDCDLVSGKYAAAAKPASTAAALASASPAVGTKPGAGPGKRPPPPKGK
jgi:hypothetical protein